MVVGASGDENVDPIVAMVEVLLSVERAAAGPDGKFVDPMVAMVEVLLSVERVSVDPTAAVVGALLRLELVEPNVAMVDVLLSPPRLAEEVEKERGGGQDVDVYSSGIASADDAAPPKPLVPATGPDELEPEPEPEAASIPNGSSPSSTRFHSATLSRFSRLLYSFRPRPPEGRATTPSYAAVPGISCGSRPCSSRQRGAASPYRGTAACIGSSAVVPLTLAGSRGNSCIVRGTPRWRALVPASAMSAALSAER
jgi:hypothetical protein